MAESPDKQIKILIADRHKLFRLGLTNALANNKDIAFVGEADSGSQLLEMLHHLNPDMIVMELILGDITGIDILPEIKQKYPHIKVVVFTLHNAAEIINMAIEAGADSYLLKNSNADTIYETIKRCYTNGFYLNDETKEAMMKVERKKNNKTKVRQGSKIILLLKFIINQQN